MLKTDFLYQKGQVLIVLLLVTLVVLTVGFAITLRSLNDLTTSTRNDQSQRAFSAAEAGIEKYLSQAAASTGLQTQIVLPNNATVDVHANIDVPANVNQALEYPPIGKETIAQFWLVDPNSLSQVPIKVYTGTTFDVYFGNEGEVVNLSTSPAIEVNVITYNSSTGLYGSQKFYLDPNSSRATPNKFITTPSVNCASMAGVTESTTAVSSTFACKYTVNFTSPPSPIAACSGTCFPIIVRIRVLYSNVNQKVAIKGIGSSLPKQAQIYYAKGTAGQSQQILRVFKMPKVIPTFLDFSVFSIGTISK